MLPEPAVATDAEPRIEPIRSGGANKPYSVLGRDYVPQTRDLPYRERGLASWYGRPFHGKRTANGEVYDMYAMTAAHPTLPLPSYARVRNPANGREVLVRVNDRGPFHAGRIVDLSYAAAARLDLLRGVAPVELERLTESDIRAGHGRREAAPSAAVAAVPEGMVAEPAAVVAESTAARAASLSPTPTSTPTPTPVPTPTRGFWVQLGAFREQAGADAFQRRAVAEIEPLAPWLATFAEATLFRVQAGPYPSRDEAQGAAQRIREALGLVPLIVERR
ncbi:MAG: septal ring lytic transglycosylase RlpA family protein [Caldimonas sp.]